MQDTKTPTKRKSMGPNPGSNKKVKGGENITPLNNNKKSPKKNKNPNQQNGSSPQKNQKKNKQENESLVMENSNPVSSKKQKKNKRVLDGSNDSSPPKKQKLEMFAGTSNLNVSKTDNAGQKKQKYMHPFQFVKAVRESIKSANKEEQAELLSTIKSKISDLQAINERSNTQKNVLNRLIRLTKRFESGEMNNTQEKKIIGTAKTSQKRRDRRNRSVKEAIEIQEDENKIWSEDAKKSQMNRNKGKKDNAKPKIAEVKENKNKNLDSNAQQKNVSKKQNKAEKPKMQKPQPKMQVEKTESDDTSGDDSDYDAEAIIKVDKIAKKMNEKSDDEDEEKVEESEESEETEETNQNGSLQDSDSNEVDDENEDDESEEDDDDKNEEDAKITVKKNVKQKKEMSTEKNLKQVLNAGVQGKSRYVVFVGNLAYTVTEGEIENHFTKAGKVKDVRIVKDKGTNKPRGFAYVEFLNETDFEKAFSLHHTFLNERRINVLYTQGGKKKTESRKKEIKIKNMKINSMRDKGMLAGSVKNTQKRSFRRNKQKNENKSDD